MNLYTLSCIAAFTPLVGSILAGFLGWKLGRRFAHLPFTLPPSPFPGLSP